MCDISHAAGRDIRKSGLLICNLQARFISKHNNTQSTRLDFQLVHRLKELHLAKYQIISLASSTIFAQEIVPKKPIEDSDSSSVQHFRESRLSDLTAPEYIRPSVFRPDLDRPG